MDTTPTAVDILCIKADPNIHLGSNMATHTPVHIKPEIMSDLCSPILCLECGKHFNTIKSLNNHINYSHTSIRCQTCGKQFRNRGALNYHFDRAHIILPCNICGKTLFKKSLKAHMLTHIGKYTFRCDMCGKQFEKRQELHYHKTTAHAEKYPYRCDVCRRGFPKIHTLQLHLRIHTTEKPYKCTFCDKRFRQKGNCNSHRQSHRKEKPYKCDLCGKCFARKGYLMAVHSKIHLHLNLKTYKHGNLAEHSITHTEENEHKCDICAKEFEDAKSLKHHIKTHMDVKQDNSDVCSKEIEGGFELTSDMMTHVDDKVVKCSECSRSFRMNKLLVAHQKDHVEVKTYLCNTCEDQVKLTEHKKTHSQTEMSDHTYAICNRGFDNKDNLVQNVNTHKQQMNKFGVHFDELTHLASHMIEHSLQTSYKCIICDKGFADEDTLLVHQRSHTQVQQYRCQCTSCYQIFWPHSRFLKHMKICKGPKKYRCNHCNQMFWLRSRLVRHMGTCKGTNKYRCQLCGKMFQDNATLDKHMTIHGDEAPYKCLICYEGFTTCSNFEKHMNTHIEREPDKSYIYNEELNMKKSLLVQKQAPVTIKKPYKDDACDSDLGQTGNMVPAIMLSSAVVPATMLSSAAKLVSNDLAPKTGLMPVGTETRIPVEPVTPVGTEIAVGTGTPIGTIAPDSVVITPIRALTAVSTISPIGAGNNASTDSVEVETVTPDTLTCRQQKSKQIFMCDIHGLQISTLPSMMKHLTTRTTPKSYKCNICAKKYTLKAQLDEHLRIHPLSSEKPYKCDICHKCFHADNSMKEHREKHKGSKPYKCVACSYSYNAASSIRHPVDVYGELSHSGMVTLSNDSNNTISLNAHNTSTPSLTNDMKMAGHNFIKVEPKTEPIPDLPNAQSDSLQSTKNMDIKLESDHENVQSGSHNTFHDQSLQSPRNTTDFAKEFKPVPQTDSPVESKPRLNNIEPDDNSNNSLHEQNPLSDQDTSDFVTNNPDFDPDFIPSNSDLVLENPQFDSYKICHDQSLQLSQNTTDLAKDFKSKDPDFSSDNPHLNPNVSRHISALDIDNSDFDSNYNPNNSGVDSDYNANDSDFELDASPSHNTDTVPELPYLCQVCKERFSSCNLLLEHIQSAHY